MSLFEIDRLIRKTEYDEALKQLNIYMEKNPDQFDNVQSRISKIMNAKIRYSELAEELLDIIRNDPTNNKKIYEITAELERFERNPSDKNLKFIADLKKSAEFNYFRAQFLEIQEAVAEYNNKQKYTDAIKKAQEGFWLYKENFYVKWEDYPEIISGVEGVVNTLTSHLLQFENKNFLPEITKVINEFIKEVRNGQYDAAQKKFNAVRQKMAQYNSLRSDIIGDKLKMEKAVAELQKLDPDMTDASYLPFLIHFMTGVDKVENSGIITALDNQFNYLVQKMHNTVFEVVMKNYNDYTNGITQEYKSTLNNYVKLNKDVLALYDLPNRDENTALVNPLNDYNMLLSYVENLCDASLEASDLLLAVDANKVLQETEIQNLKNDTSSKNKVSYLNKLVNYSENLEKIAPSRDVFDSSYKEWSSSYKNSDYDNFDGLTSNYENLVKDIYETKDGILNNTWNVITSYYMALSENLYNSLKDFTLSFDDYNNGLLTKLNEDALKAINKDVKNVVLYKNPNDISEQDIEIGIFYRYPDITKDMVTYVEKEIRNRTKEIDGYKKEMNKMFSKVEDWANREYLNNKVKDANDYLDDMISKINALTNDANRYYNEANELLIQSELAQNEGDLRYSEAEKALKKDDFTLARRKLQNAVTKYDESLSFRNDEGNREKWDNKLQKLGNEIAMRENELVVQEVRVLKNKAKDAYFNGRYDDAEKYLNQASTKWSVTNSTEDPEIENLRNFVNTAISMKTGRDITPSAPQYPEMSQLINIARTSYEEGSKLFNQGEKDKAEEQFDIAEASIQKVQYVYPLNQDAALLTLQINKIKDPKKFNNELANKIDTAKNECRNGDAETRQRGYTNLLDYHALEPNYPGLADLIYQVEIDLGIRQRPVDNSGKIKAQKYIAEANKIFKRANNNKEWNAALNKVEAALELLPYSNDTKDLIAEASELKDKIKTKMGGDNKTVLSTEDERMYQKAIRCLQENKIATARAIVDDLLSKPENRYSNKIKDLKSQIDARS